MRRAKIVCTLGPASSEPAFIGNLVDEGMDVARVNFSHGDRQGAGKLIAAVRQQAEIRGRPVGILQDLGGPKIRIGRFTAGEVELEPGNEFTITTRDVAGDCSIVSTTYAALPQDVKPRTLMLLDDGNLQLEVDHVDGPDIVTRVVIGGTLKNNKGINLPGVKVSAPALTEKDKLDLKFGLDQGVDFIALSFVRSANDVREAVHLATRGNRRTPIIAKIEKPEAVECLDEIVEVADGVMVARGDLGVELGPEKVPLIQKRCIEATNSRGKIVITATQMLESMIANPRPTRAEASDVANAVLDGTDALMLSGETATGRYPLLAVRTMSRIIEEIETSARYKSRFDSATLDIATSTNAIAKAACVAARQMAARTIVCVSESGGAPRLLSEYRPEAPIIALTSDPTIVRQLALYWGIVPMQLPTTDDVDELLSTVSRLLIERRLCKSGDLVVFTISLPYGEGLPTNALHIHRV